MLWPYRIMDWFDNHRTSLRNFFTRGGMSDFTQITPQLWTGGAVTNEADVDQMLGAGITADIDCRLTQDTGPLDWYTNLPNHAPTIKGHPKIAYCYNGVPDDGEPKPVSWFEKSWNFAKPILESGGVVLAHCAAGHNRGPSTCYFLLRAYNGMAPDAAFKLLTTRRPVATVKYREDADRAIAALGLE